MKTSAGRNSLFVILGMFGLLAISFGLDRLILAMKEYVAAHLKEVVTMLLLFPLSTIIIATGALLLFWFVIARMKKNYLVSTVFIIIGVFIALLVLANVQPLSSNFLFLQPFLLPSSNLFVTGTIVMVIGILNLVLPHPKE